MEWKIGEIRQIDGEWYQCVESHFSCEGCDFKNTSKCSHEGVECSYPIRQDHTSVIFKKLEKVGEPCEFQKRAIQTYKLYTEPFISVDMDFINTYLNGSDTIDIIITQDIEDMGENKTQLPKEDNSLTKVVYAYVNGKISDNELIKSIKEMSDEYPFEKNNLKPFSLEEAKQGKPVCTRDGRKVRIISFDREFLYDGQNYCIVALINDGPHNEIVYSYTKDGLYNPGKIHERDLMMLSEKKSGWIVICKDAMLYNSEEAAKNVCANDNYIPVKVEFEI